VATTTAAGILANAAGATKYWRANAFTVVADELYYCIRLQPKDLYNCRFSAASAERTLEYLSVGEGRGRESRYSTIATFTFLNFSTSKKPRYQQYRCALLSIYYVIYLQ
jgi:hypothetical protein